MNLENVFATERRVRGRVSQRIPARVQPPLSLEVLHRKDGKPEDTQGRHAVLQALYRQYAVEVAGAEGEIVYRDELPPPEWLNLRLAAGNAQWRVHACHGSSCEVVELNSAVRPRPRG